MELVVASSSHNLIFENIALTVNNIGGILTINYSGSAVEKVFPAGKYKLECYGSKGNRGNYGYNNAGKGGYSVGNLILTEETTLYIYVGGGNAGSTRIGGWNGGGTSAVITVYGGGGGGASDIRIGGTALTDRIIVAGGGGGGSRDGNAGYGGGSSGGNASSGGATGGTQIAGGDGDADGTLGNGGNGGSRQGAGGGGYYGGGAAISDYATGAGGSGFISEILEDASTTGNVRDDVGIVYITYMSVVDFSSHNLSSDNLTLEIHNPIDVNNTEHLITSDNVELSVDLGTIQLVISNPSHNISSTEISLVYHESTVELSINTSTNIITSDVLVLLQHNILDISNIAHTVISDNISLVQHHSLVVNNTTHSLNSDNIELTSYTLYQLVIDNTAHIIYSDSVDLIQHFVLVINNTTHELSEISLDLIQHQELLVENSTNTLVSENTLIIQHNVLLVNNCTHVIEVTDFSFIQHHKVVITDSIHNLISSNIILFGVDLYPSFTIHLLESDNVDLLLHVPTFTLLVNNTEHIVSSDNPNLLQNFVLNTSSTTHSIDSDSISLSGITLLVDDSVHFISSDNLELTAFEHYIVWTDSVTHEHISYEIDVKDVNVISAGVAVANGLYTFTDVFNGKNRYAKVSGEAWTINWQPTYYSLNNVWLIRRLSDNIVYYYAKNQTVATPDLVPIWTRNAGFPLSVPSVIRAFYTITLSSHQSIVVNSSSHVLNSDEVVVSEAFRLSPNDSIISLNSESNALLQHQILDINNTSLIVESNNLDLNVKLTIQDSVQQIESDIISIEENIDIIVSNSIHQLESDILLLEHNPLLILNDSNHVIDSTDLTLVQHGYLLIDSSAIAQICLNIILLHATQGHFPFMSYEVDKEANRHNITKLDGYNIEKVRPSSVTRNITDYKVTKRNKI